MEELLSPDSTNIIQEQEMFNTLILGQTKIAYTAKEDGFDEIVIVKRPTLKQKETSEALYAKVYNRYLQDPDHMTVRQLLDNAKTRGIWSDEDEDNLAKSDIFIVELKEKIKLERSEKAKRALEKELAKHREDKFRLAIKLGQITATSIESISEKERYEYLVLNCIFVLDADGNEVPLYKNRDELNSEINMKKLERIIMDARSFWSGEGLTDFLHLGD